MTDQDYLARTLSLAATRRGFCAPNPAVGAVVVKAGKVLGEGAHQACGQPHAEVEAFSACVDGAARGATMYVSLEPCCHQGRTPPCVEAIIRQGVARVVYAMRDPNPKVQGGGHRALEAAGIDVEHLPVDSISEFYQSYLFWQRTGQPFVTTKLALSLDAKIAGEAGVPITITGDALQTFTHQQRLATDAILTTVQTVLKDDPLLTVRLPTQTCVKSLYILDSQLRTPLTARVFATDAKVTMLCDDTVESDRRALFEKAGVTCIPIEKQGTSLNLHAVMKVLGLIGVHDLWVEAGAQLNTNLWQAGLVNRGYFYMAPKVLGHSAVPGFGLDAIDFSNYNARWQVMGTDVMCELNEEDVTCLPV